MSFNNAFEIAQSYPVPRGFGSVEAQSALAKRLRNWSSVIMNLNAYLTGSDTIIHCPGDSIYFSHCLTSIADNIDKYFVSVCPSQLVPSARAGELILRLCASGMRTVFSISNEFVDIQFGELQLVRR